MRGKSSAAPCTARAPSPTPPARWHGPPDIQRTADLLVDQGLAEYLPSPAHTRAKLLRLTERGWKAIRGMTDAQHDFINRIAGHFTAEELTATASLMAKLAQILADDEERRTTQA